MNGWLHEPTHPTVHDLHPKGTHRWPSGSTHILYNYSSVFSPDTPTPHTSFENAILCTAVEVFTEVECVPLKAFISYFLGYRLINPRVTSKVEWLNLRRLWDFIAPVMVSLGRLDASLKSSLKSCLITSLYDARSFHMLWYSSILHDSQLCDLLNSCDNTSKKKH